MKRPYDLQKEALIAVKALVFLAEQQVERNMFQTSTNRRRTVDARAPLQRK